MKKKQLAAMALAAVMLIGYEGGSTAPDATKTVDNGASAAADTGKKKADSQRAEPDEAITITLVESLTSPEKTAILRKTVDKYQAEHLNITIDIISPSLENVNAKIVQILMDGSGAGIVEARDFTVTQYATNKWIADFRKYIDAWDERGTLTGSTGEVIHYPKGGAYLIPYRFYQRGLFYRVDWFEEKGLNQLEIWQDTYGTSLAIMDPANSRFGYSPRGGLSGYQYADTIYQSWIGTDKVAGPNAAYFLKNGDGATIPILSEVKEVLHFYKDLFKNICLTDLIMQGFSGMVQGFVGGTTVVLIQDSEIIAICPADIRDDQQALVPFPKRSSGQAALPDGFADWGITSFTEYPDETTDLLLYLSNSENNTYFAKNYSIIPIHNNAAEKDPCLSEGRFAMYIDMAKEPDIYRHAAYPQMYEAFATCKTEADTMYQKYPTDEITGDELLQWLDEFWTQAYKDEDRKW